MGGLGELLVSIVSFEGAAGWGVAILFTRYAMRGKMAE